MIQLFGIIFVIQLKNNPHLSSVPMNVIYWPSYIDESFTLEENDRGSIQIRL